MSRPHFRSRFFSVFLLTALLGGFILPVSATVTESTIYTLNLATTGGANLSLTAGRDGLLYGMTVPVDDGTGTGTFWPAHIFTLSTTGAYHSLYTIPGNLNSYSVGGPGLLEGTGTDTSFYGALADSIFKVSSAGAFSTLKTYDSTTYTGQLDGGEPVGLIRGSDGNFYGVCSAYGAGTSVFGTTGVIFRLGTDGSYKVLHNFQDTADPSFNPDGTTAVDGFTPNCNLVQGKDGNFYGTTQYGGSLGWGTVFQMTPAGHVTILKSFDFAVGDGGAEPECGLVFGPDGTTLYGRTTVGNVPGFDSDIYGGTLFSITTTGVFKILHTWDTVTGDATSEVQDQSDLILASDGNFYGTANQGLFFQLTPAGVYTILYDFAVNEPVSIFGMTQGLDGCFYGYEGVSVVWKISAGLPPVTGGGGTTAQIPVITGLNTVTGGYQIVASNAPTHYAATGLPPGLVLNTTTGLISGTPTAIGTFVATLTASNAAGTSSPVTVTFNLTAPTPVIDSSLAVTGNVGQAFSYTISATGSPTSFNATNLPAGLTVNKTNGVISGTPTAAGTTSVLLTAKNASGSGTATLLLTIKAALPVITSSLSATGTEGSPFSYQITATNSPTSFAIQDQPGGITVNATTGLISGTPTVSGVWPITLFATNSGGTSSAVLNLTLGVAKTTQTITFPAIAAKTTTSAAFTLTATASSKLAVTYSVVSGPATVSGSTVTLTGVAGTVVIQASQAGNNTYTAATSVKQSFVVTTAAKTAQTITFPAIAAKTTTSAAFTLTATASSKLAVTYSVVSGPATVSGSTVTLTGVAGTVVIQASQAGNNTYTAATSVKQSFVVTTAAKTAQTITFPAIAAKTTTSAAFTLTATASSKLAVTYSVVSGPATVSGSTVTLTGVAGTVVIQASQPGNNTYAAATSVKQSFTVTAAAMTVQTITFPAIAAKTTTSAAFTLTATASSKLAVTYSVVSGPATVSGSTVTLTGVAGTVVIQASQPGNNTYAAATSVKQSFTVTAAAKTAQTITWATLPVTRSLSAGSFKLTATASSGLAVVYTLYQGSPATISGSTITPTGTGVVIIYANQPGNNAYAAAPVVAQDFVVTSP